MSGKVLCSWCGKVIVVKGPRMRLFESQSVRTEGRTLASFHPQCGDAMLDYCEARSDESLATRLLMAKADLMRRAQARC
jgi:hypothetical protein